jgi:L-2-hydroxyglutarate oxidase LhgO
MSSISKKENYDFVIIGAGIIGLTIADSLLNNIPNSKIAIIDKEFDVAQHASGRNSGVIHAGIYYKEDSNKSKFCVKGNQLLKQFCVNENIPINNCGKIIVTKNEQEESSLIKLYERGKRNGANLDLLDKNQVKEIEPLAKTYQTAIFSHDTASVNPSLVCSSLKRKLIEKGVAFIFNEQVISFRQNKTSLLTNNKKEIGFGRLINCSGLYADTIANEYGLKNEYQIIPFKGLYLLIHDLKLNTNIYPVPDPDYPFLGVHFTVTSDGKTKVGPTAIPALWREQYHGFKNFTLKEFSEIFSWYIKAFFSNYFNFRHLLKVESKYILKSQLLNDASLMLNKKIDMNKNSYLMPGIRAQLYDKNKCTLVDDFVVEAKDRSVHILNAVSPAFTCSFAIAQQVVRQYLI